MSKQIKQFYEFGDFRIDTVNRRLLKHGEVVPLKAKAVETLLLLIEHKGDVVEKDFLMQQLWADSFVEEANLTQNIYTLRKAFDGNDFIETIPRRGYRFTADVNAWIEDEPDDLIVVREKTRVKVSYESEAHANTSSEPAVDTIPTLTSAPRTNKWLVTIAAVSVSALVLVLLWTFWPTRLPFRNFRLAKLTTSGKAWKTAISPDGRYLAFVSNDLSQQSLWLRQIATGKDLELSRPGPTQYYGLTFSHDGDYLYYTSRQANNPAVLYRVGTLGGEPMKLADDVDSPITLTADDKQLAFYRFSREDRALFVANADGTQQRKLAASTKADQFVLAPEWDTPPPAWSPNNKAIVCTVGVPDPAGKYETLWGFDVESGASSPITSARWEDMGRPEWIADGSGLILAAAGEGTGFVFQIWHVAYPSGKARQITNDLDDYRDMSLTRDGTTVVAVRAERRSNISVMTASDPGSARQVSSSNYDGINGLFWTPDDRVVYTRLATGEQNLWVTDPAAGEPRALTNHAGFMIQPVVTPDGRYVVFAANHQGKAHIWRADIDGRNPVEITNGLEDIQPTVTADGQWVVYKSISAELMRVSINGGEAEAIGRGSMPAVSPDGAMLAYTFRPSPSEPTKWFVKPLNGGEARAIADLPPLGVRFMWTPDSKALTYAPQQEPYGNVWVQPIEGGPPRQITSGNFGRIFSLGWSRDGSKLAIGSGTLTSDVVSVKNVP